MRRCRPGLGTFVEIAIVDAGTGTDARGASDAAFRAIARVDATLSFQDPASLLSRINREASDRPVAVDDETFALLVLARDIFQRSGGRFDCTVADGLATFADVILDDGARTVRFAAPLALDLGGIAKGHAVDRAIDALAAHGIAGAVVNAGGDLRVLGPVPQPIHVRGAADDAPPILVGTLADGAFATSSNGASRRGRRRTPGVVVDRARRCPAAADRTWSVIAPTCIVADALTKIVASDARDAAGLVESFGATAFVS